MNLLSVDWDFFFTKLEDPSQQDFKKYWGLYDWGHRESNLFIDGPIWPSRAADFMRFHLPLPSTTGEEAGFWRRFRFTPRTTLFVGESHSEIAVPRVSRYVNRVWNFDAHHDAGYKNRETVINRIVQEGTVSCDDWAAAFSLLNITDLHVRYPRWRAYALKAEPAPAVPIDRGVDQEAEGFPTFDRIFLCRSGAWTPPWVDEQFFAFVAACPARRTVWLDDLKPRVWREAAEQALATRIELERLQAAVERKP